MAAMTAAALPYALAGYEVILDFSMPPWFLDTALKIISKRDVLLQYIVLLPAENICAARAAARMEGKITDYAPYHDLYVSFAEAQHKNIIHDDLSDAATIAKHIRKGLSNDAFSLMDSSE